MLYVVQFGNNSGVIRQLMRARPGWAPGAGDPANPAGKTVYELKTVKVPLSEDLPDIHFLWTQYPCKAFHNAMASKAAGVQVVSNEEARLQMKAGRTARNTPAPQRMYNHFEGSAALTNKADLRDTIVAFYLRHGRDPFSIVPPTFVVRGGTSDAEFAIWRRMYDGNAESTGQRMWLVKPGDKANRGNGIRIYDDAEELAERVDSKERCWVIQKYMEAPLLVHRRKFDIRAYCLVTQEPGGGAVRAYCYQEAYLRTTSVEYSTKTKDRMVHLNNDAVQKKGGDYGKFEAANKLSLQEFQRYLDEHHPRDGYSVQGALMPQMRSLMADTIRAAQGQWNPRNIDGCFQVFGFDFMVDTSFRAWLIEVNNNPCLELCNAYLSYLIPRMLEEALQLTLDRAFPHAASAPGGATGWEEVYCSSGPGADVVSCDWAAALPPEEVPGHPDLARMGAAFTALRPVGSSRARKRSRGPRGPKSDADSAPAGGG